MAKPSSSFFVFSALSETIARSMPQKRSELTMNLHLPYCCLRFYPSVRSFWPTEIALLRNHLWRRPWANATTFAHQLSSLSSGEAPGLMQPPWACASPEIAAKSSDHYGSKKFRPLWEFCLSLHKRNCDVEWCKCRRKVGHEGRNFYGRNRLN